MTMLTVLLPQRHGCPYSLSKILTGLHRALRYVLTMLEQCHGQLVISHV
jgi:hypothetical protein